MNFSVIMIKGLNEYIYLCEKKINSQQKNVEIIKISSKDDIENAVISASYDNIILLGENCIITNNFFNNIKGYDPNFLILGRVDYIRNSRVVIDKRIGISNPPVSLDCLVFNKNFIKSPLISNNNKIFKNNIKVLNVLRVVGNKNKLVADPIINVIPKRPKRVTPKNKPKRVTPKNKPKRVIPKRVIAKKITPKKNPIPQEYIPIDYKISLIIPYMYNGDRWDLFDATIKNLYELTKDDDNVEICVHETDSKPKIPQEFLEKYEIKHLFTKWDEVFHRGWSLNVAGKYLATGDKLVFMDADLIVDKSWLNEIKLKDDGVYYGWGKMMNLKKSATNIYLKNGKILNEFDRIREPKKGGAAGGVTVISKKLFMDIKGWPEDFRYTYGGEDNAFAHKVIALGYKMEKFQTSVYHLYHEHITKRSDKRFEIFRKMKRYNATQWKKHMEDDVNWGEPNKYE